MKYDLFISYSHSDENIKIRDIQRLIENLGKPWFKLTKNLNVFRDETNLNVNPDLWGTIISALNDSSYFLLLASPKGAKSLWIEKEVSWWLSNHTTDTLFIGIIDGVVSWNPLLNDFDWSYTNCLPNILQGKFLKEPLLINLVRDQNESTSIYVDKQKSQISKIVGSITDLEPYQIVSDEITRRRKIKFLVFGIIVILFVLITISIYGFYINKNLQNVADSNSYLAQANDISRKDVNKALSLYYKAYQLNQTQGNFSILKDYYESMTSQEDTSEGRSMNDNAGGVFNGFFKVVDSNTFLKLKHTPAKQFIKYGDNDTSYLIGKKVIFYPSFYDENTFQNGNVNWIDNNKLVIFQKDVFDDLNIRERWSSFSIYFYDIRVKRYFEKVLKLKSDDNLGELTNIEVSPDLQYGLLWMITGGNNGGGGVILYNLKSNTYEKFNLMTEKAQRIN